MSITWRKVWRDLTQSKAKALLVILSVAVGVFALGMVFGLADILKTRMTQDHLATLPAHISFGGGPFSIEAAEAIESEFFCEDVLRTTQTTFRWKLPGETEWRTGGIVARPDYGSQRINRLDLLAGLWPAEGILAIERQSSRYYDLGLSASIVIQYGKRERALPIEGIVRDAAATPPQFGSNPTFYVTPETVRWLSGLDAPNRLAVRITSYSDAKAEEAAQKIQDRLQDMNIRILGYEISDPNTHPLQDLVDTMTTILTILGMLSLGLSAFLIVNTMRALIIQQTWQIGVMKVYGATFGRVTCIYLLTTLVYGALAALVAIPSATLATYWTSKWLLDLVNIGMGPFRIAPIALVVQIVVSLAIPALAALGPVLSGAHLTPHQSMSSHGLGERFGKGWLDRLVTRLRHLPRPLVLSLRNSFRRKARVALTVITLAIAGVMFVTVMSVNDSLDATLDTLISDLGMDIWVVFEEPERAERLIEIAQMIPSVENAEVWDQRAADLSLGNGEEESIYLMGVPTESALFMPRIVAGRNILPEDGHAILLNNKIASEQDLQVGDQVKLVIGSRTSVWTIVGLIVSITNDQRDCFVPLSILSRETASVNRGTVVMVSCSTPNREALVKQLRDTYLAQGLPPAFLNSADEIREQTRSQFDIILSLMLIMAVLAALVGSFGLTGTLSINVLERSREIGVMRTIGATSFAITTIFVSEGLLLGVFSWLLSAPLSYPGSQLFGQMVGTALFGVPLDFSYSTHGAILWLGIVILLSLVGSLGPALRAANIRVIKVLRFE